ncbi:EAL domain-containing protein [Massilia sp. METH4]|uniref:putative bifunctional diguanylate cyclase/phosphodiesterase n=1 Tax=Massilia sp. METH4 TaxID=3123041 RepID=UPI0030D0477D
MDFNDIAQWRVRIFKSVMSIVQMLTLVTALPTMALALHHGLNQIVLIDTVALGTVFVIWRLRRLPYAVRVWCFLALIYGVSVLSMITIDAFGICYMLMALPIMAVIFLGVRPALISLAAAAGTVLVLGLAGFSVLAVAGYPPHAVQGVFILTVNFTCIAALVTLTCDTMLKGLSRSLDHARTVTGSLEERQAALHALNCELQLTSAALAGLNEMVLIVKAVDGRGTVQPVIFANAAFERRSGYRADEIIGRSMRMLHGPDTDPVAIATVVDAMARYEPVSVQTVHYTKAGAPYWIELDMVPFAGEAGPITHWVSIARDITEQRRAANAVHQLAFFDVLTGLPNRRLLMERLDALVAKAHAGRGLGSVLFIDLDNFKHVNDARGHATGDALLRHVAARLSSSVRKGDTVARLGGDEFVVLLEDLGNDESVATTSALRLADQVCAALREPLTIDGQFYHSSGSIGVALPTRAGQTVQDLLREADTAMYHAKAAGRKGVALFQPTMLASAEQALTLERDLLSAMQNDELALHLQLQVAPDGTPVGAETLLRWRRADGTMTPPDVFIPVAEATGLIVPLGAWVLRQACLAWRELDAAGCPLPLSVNVSPRQFREPDFVSSVKATLLETGMRPQQLILEVTEGLLVDNLDETVTRMGDLTTLGIRFSIDDFGTGYSNLAYLRKMPLYELKIDRSFMRDMPHDANGMAIVQSILAMAGHLGLRVVAEGIETVEQARFLAMHGAPCMQGYLYCRPVPLPEVVALLKKNPPMKLAA